MRRSQNLEIKNQLVISSLSDMLQDTPFLLSLYIYLDGFSKKYLDKRSLILSQKKGLILSQKGA